jgi:hypothetical protein
MKHVRSLYNQVFPSKSDVECIEWCVIFELFGSLIGIKRDYEIIHDRVFHFRDTKTVPLRIRRLAINSAPLMTVPSGNPI